jgi:hypothetical protein
MPEIKCHAGHTMHVGTAEWVAALTLDQARYAREKMDEKIKAAEAMPKRIVWRVCRGGVCDGNYPEDQYEKAADHLLRIFKDKFMEEAADYVKKPYGTETFRRELPSIEIERVTQLEYDTEWFPKKS